MIFEDTQLYFPALLPAEQNWTQDAQSLASA